MRKLFTFMAAAAFLFGTAAASAAPASVSATLNVAIGTLPAAGFAGAGSGSSNAAGGAATIQASVISGVFQTAIVPPLLTLLDGIGVGLPGLAANANFSGASPAVNNPLSFNGATGTMSLNASAYLLMTNLNQLEIPLGVVGVGGTQMFHALTLVAGVINANPYQLGVLTLMGALNTAPHTLMATGVDNRDGLGNGTLVLVSPTNVNLGVLGSLASLATLTLTYSGIIPEPGTLLLLGAGVAGLAAIGRKRMA